MRIVVLLLKVFVFAAPVIALCNACAVSPRLTAEAISDPTWQFSIPLEPSTERRAYLWVPPRCRHVRGVLFGLQNMLERSMFEDMEIRSTLTKLNMGIVLVSPGAWPDKSLERQPSLNYVNAAKSIAGVQMVLRGLATESGYPEIEDAPIILAGHSAASPFIWGVAKAWPQRIIALIPFKGYPVPSIVDDIPTLKIEQEWSEWGPEWGEAWRNEIQQAEGQVRLAEHPLFGDVTDVGTGHFDWNHDIASIVGMFMRKAASARLQSPFSSQSTLKLKAVSNVSGVLVDPAKLGSTNFSAISYPAWRGDPRNGFWYFDREMARAVNDYMLSRLKKRPQAINFFIEGKPIPLNRNGFAVIQPHFLADGITFQVHAEALRMSPSPKLYKGAPLGHADGPILYRVSSGALEQTGPDTFRVAPRSGGLTRQGQPWEPWIMAYQPGDAKYRSADRPAHVIVGVRHQEGEQQSLQFTKLNDVVEGSRSISLSAKTSSSLQPDFYVESGPAVVQGTELLLLPIPVKARYPVRVIVSAYQWGRVGEKPVHTAGPDTQQFFIQRK